MSALLLDVLYKALNVLVSLTIIITFISKVVSPTKRRLLSEHKKFTDRKEQLCFLIDAIRRDNKIINVYGKKGIGKSYFLKYFSDLVNNKISIKETDKFKYRELKNLRKEIRNSYVIYYEVNEYTKESEIINDFSSNYANRFSKNPYKSFKNMIRNLFLYKKLIIIFDNITNECLENTIENIISNLLPYSKKLVFIIGSVDYLTFPKLNINKSKIEITEFGKYEIEEYSINCGNKLTEDKLNNIVDISNGLPIIVDLMISNNSYNFFNYVLDKYIESLFNKIRTDNPYLSRVLLLLSLLSIVNSNVSLSLLNSVTKNTNINRKSVQELNSLSVIKYNEKDDTIKVHDIIRDYLVYEHAQRDYYDLIEQLVNYYKGIDDYASCSVYSILLEKEDYYKYKSIIKECIVNALDSENYAFLLAIGIHYFKSIPQEDDNMFYLISYGYISALLSVGDYPSAKRFCDEKRLSLNGAVNENQIDLALEIANLHHLQSDYLVAIELYKVLLKICIEDRSHNECIANCYLKIAHAYRHIADYINAQEFYFLAIKNTKNKDIIVSAYLELSVIYLFDSNLLKNDPNFKNMDDLFNKIKELLGDDKNSLQLLYLRNYARYLLSKQDIHYYSDTILDYLNQALLGYEQLKKRLIYTMNFEFGEYYRMCSKNEKAIDYYRESLRFSYRNGDKNLETMSYIGIVLSELQCGIHYHTKTQNSQIELLVKCIDISDKHNLKINSLLAHVLLKYIKTNTLFEDEFQLLCKNNYNGMAILLKKADNKLLNKIQLFMM